MAPCTMPSRMKLDELTSSNAFSNGIMLVIMVNVVLWLGSLGSQLGGAEVDLMGSVIC